MTAIAAWARAARPLAHANIAPAIAFGQALAWTVTGRFDAARAALAFTFGVLDHLFIVFANDYADRDADAVNTAPTPFSGGSRVLQEGRLTPRALRAGAFVAAGALLALGALVAWRTGEAQLFALAGVAIALLHAYSFAPFRLSYRGGGELLQGAGVGVVLPVVGYVAQAGTLASLPWRALVVTFVLGVAGNVTTALPDVDADQQAQKRTWAVRHGVRRARLSALLLVAVGAALVLALSPPLPVRALAAVSAPPVAAAMALAALENAVPRVTFVALAAGLGGYIVLAWSVALVTCGS